MTNSSSKTPQWTPPRSESVQAAPGVLQIAVGVGCRRSCSADEILSLITEALESVAGDTTVRGLYSTKAKSDEVGLRDAARRLGVRLEVFDDPDLLAVNSSTRTLSPHSLRVLGLPSVAEAAALAGAGPGATLIVSRRSSARVTCAIAQVAARDVDLGSG